MVSAPQLQQGTSTACMYSAALQLLESAAVQQVRQKSIVMTTAAGSAPQGRLGEDLDRAGATDETVEASTRDG
jgi:hypothetical protein